MPPGLHYGAGYMTTGPPQQWGVSSHPMMGHGANNEGRDANREIAVLQSRVSTLENDLGWANENIYKLRDVVFGPNRTVAPNDRGDRVREPRPESRQLEPSSYKRPRRESPESDGGDEQSSRPKGAAYQRPGRAPQYVGPSRVDKGRGPAYAGTSSSRDNVVSDMGASRDERGRGPAQAGPSSTRKSGNTGIPAGESLRKALNTQSWDYKVEATKPRVDGPTSGWISVITSKGYLQNTKQLNLVFKYWGRHDVSERTRFITELDDAMNNYKDSRNAKFLASCTTWYTTWVSVKNTTTHADFFKSAWLVYLGWKNPLTAEKRQAAQREDSPDLETSPPITYDEMEKEAMAKADGYGYDHPTHTMPLIAWVAQALKPKSESAMKFRRRSTLLSDNGVAYDLGTAESNDVMMWWVAGEWFCHLLRPTTGNALIRRRVIRRYRVLFQDLHRAIMRAGEMGLSAVNLAYTAVETDYWKVEGVKPAPFPIGSDGVFSDDELLKHYIENGSPDATRAMNILALNIGPRNSTPWVETAHLAEVREKPVGERDLPVDITLASLFETTEHGNEPVVGISEDAEMTES